MQKNAEPIKDVLDKIIKKLAAEETLDKTGLLKKWARIAGKKAARHSRPVSFRNSQLVISVDSSSWLYELNSNKRTILKKLASVPGGAGIKNIRFRIGKII